MKFNPYIAGNPIRGQFGFYGREDVFREVTRVLNHPKENAIVLFGQRRIGKTSILLQLKESLTDTGEFVAVYFDLMDKASKDLPDVLNELAQKISEETNVAVNSSTDFDENGSYFRETFLPQVTEAIGDKKLVLLFDEFDVLDTRQQDQAGQRFFPYLRSWMMDIESVQFVFVIGRRPEELSIDTLATFKNIKSAAVALLDLNSTEEIIRQSEKNESLYWNENSIKRVWYWTNGHPYLTQLLCSVVWENLYETEPIQVPTASKQDVDKMVNAAMQQGRNAFQWIWDGLPPAERVVMSAMAEAGDVTISHDELIRILRNSGVRLIVRELELAPETLVNWGWLKEMKGGYRFIVQLLRTWVAANRPLRRVKEELDRLEPLAEGLYQTGQRFYSLKQIDESISQLRQALTINPNHLKSRLLLGRILIEKSDIQEAISILEEAHQYDPDASRAIYTQALLIQADSQEDEEQLTAYEKILEIDHEQPVARERRSQIIKKIGLQKGKEYEQAERWDDAIAIYESTLKEFPKNKQIAEAISNAKVQAKMAKSYALGIVAVEEGRLDEAQYFFAQTIAVQPDYKEASRYLYEIHQGIIKVAKKKKPEEKLVDEEQEKLKVKSAVKPSEQKNEKTSGSRSNVFGAFSAMYIFISMIIFALDMQSDYFGLLFMVFSPIVIVASTYFSLWNSVWRPEKEAARNKLIDVLKISGVAIGFSGIPIAIIGILYETISGNDFENTVIFLVVVPSVVIAFYLALSMFKNAWKTRGEELSLSSDRSSITIRDYLSLGGLFFVLFIPAGGFLLWLAEYEGEPIYLWLMIPVYILAFFLAVKLGTGILHRHLEPDKKPQHRKEFLKALGIFLGVGTPIFLTFIFSFMVIFYVSENYDDVDFVILSGALAVPSPFWAMIVTIELRKSFFVEVFELRRELKRKKAAEKLAGKQKLQEAKEEEKDTSKRKGSDSEIVELKDPIHSQKDSDEEKEIRDE